MASTWPQRPSASTRGPSKIETTQIYLRRLDMERQMETVKDLTWGNRFDATAVKAPSGFEPLYEALQASA